MIPFTQSSKAYKCKQFIKIVSVSDGLKRPDVGWVELYLVKP